MCINYTKRNKAIWLKLIQKLYFHRSDFFILLFFLLLTVYALKIVISICKSIIFYRKQNGLKSDWDCCFKALQKIINH